MARHEVVIHENTGATKESAPYLGSYIAKETVSMSMFAAVVGAKCGLPPIQVMAILGGAFDAIAALEAESLVRVHTDIGVVCGVITGSFPTADAAFDPARNALELALRLDERLRLDLADVTATIVTDEDVTRVRVDNAMDIHEQKPMMDQWDDFSPHLVGRRLVAHNIACERTILTRIAPLTKWGPWTDTLKVAKARYPRLPSYKLGDLCEMFGLVPQMEGRTWHDGLYDAVACAMLAIRLAG